MMVHSHCYVSGKLAHGCYRNGEWFTGTFTHTHEGGDVPHTHPQTGPSFFGHRGVRKYAKKIQGEQFSETIPLTEEENTFELIVTDSAILSVPVPFGEKVPGLVPIGNTPIEALGFPAAERMINGFGMKCIIRDERKKA